MKTKKTKNGELSFGEEAIKIKIPKFTNIMIITTISEATNGGFNVTTDTYDREQIKSFIEGEKK